MWTGRYADTDKTPIFVGDLVCLTTPFKTRDTNLVVFEVIKEKEQFYIEYSMIFSTRHMSFFSPNYRQYLHAYKIIGDRDNGINVSLLE